MWISACRLSALPLAVAPPASIILQEPSPIRKGMSGEAQPESANRRPRAKAHPFANGARFSLSSDWCGMACYSISGMKIYIGADHNGFDMKRDLLEKLMAAGYVVVDKGDEVLNPDDDFPQFAAKVVMAMRASDDRDPRGILICGSGQGMCMAANRYKGMRASLVWSVEEAHASRNDDDSNILCLPARYMSVEDAIKIAEVWLTTPFAGAARFKRRIKELDKLG
jgi:ribose 5-phosphate isomerase B